MKAKAAKRYKVGKDIDLKKTVIVDKKGRRLTDARARKIAEETIQRVVGRPSLTAKSTHSPEIKARVPKKLKVALDREAKRRGETASTLIREALEKFLKSA